MKSTALSVFGAALVLAISSGTALAQSAEFELSREGREILCKRFPLNSRCPGGTPLSATTSVRTETTSTMTSAETTMESSDMAATTSTQMGTIVDVASSSGSFNNLVAAIKAAGLADTLSGQGPFTVFAPTDEAFAALPPGAVEQLLKPENKAILAKILTYHVVPGRITSDSLTSGSVKTAEGGAVNVMVDAANNSVMVNNATVVEADIAASNGVIHVIDKIILPPDM